MTWERRGKSSGRYYYQARRRDGRVTKQYVGALADPVVALLAREDRLTKAELLAHKEVRNTERNEYEAVNVRLSASQKQLRRMLHKWRQSRAHQGGRRILKNTTTSRAGRDQRQPLTRDEFEELVKQAESGDAEALAEIRTLMQSNPATWLPFGDLTEHVKRIFLSLMVHGNVVARESLNLQLEELTQSLLQGQVSPVRKLVIDQIVLCWLDVHYQQAMSAEPRGGKTDIEFQDRRLAKARKRYYEALGFLAKMDRLEGLSPAKPVENPTL